MPVEMKRIKQVFGDRALIRRLSAVEKKGSLFIPLTHKAKPKQSEIWLGVIEHLGSGMRYPDAYGVKAGDVVGIEFTGSNCESFQGDDRESYVWVMEEFLTVIDLGAVEAFRKNVAYDGLGLRPVGPYALVEPAPEEETRNGITIPEGSKDAQRTGRVVAVSDGEIRGGDLYPLSLSVGDDILFGRYSGSWLRLGTKDYLMMKQEDVIASMVKSKVTANV